MLPEIVAAPARRRRQDAIPCRPVCVAPGASRPASVRIVPTRVRYVARWTAVRGPVGQNPPGGWIAARWRGTRCWLQLPGEKTTSVRLTGARQNIPFATRVVGGRAHTRSDITDGMQITGRDATVLETKVQTPAHHGVWDDRAKRCGAAMMFRGITRDGGRYRFGSRTWNAVRCAPKAIVKIRL